MKKINKILNIFIIDIIALAFIFFLPAISGFLNFPLYLVDPMRMMIILALAHTNKRNSYFLAILLPLFSYFIASHPYFLKTSIILLELLLNIYLFYFLISKIKNSFFSMLISIIVCKGFYYGLKFLLISLTLIEGSLISTPIKYQIITTVVFSIYIQLFFRKR
ncbi:MAG: hypothetical protein K8S00_12030 [Bacteroidales bacterium]|nr:hypothetical protein [Bacteroidales bacterium]